MKAGVGPGNNAVTDDPRVRRWLDGEEAKAAGPDLVDDLRRALAAPVGPSSLLTEQPHGSVVCYHRAPDGRRRRIAEFDRHGHLLAGWRWSPKGLEAAWLRLPDRSWLRIEPAATGEAPWGMSDRLWHTPRLEREGRPLTVLEALPYDHVDRIPVLAEPGHLPPGGGSVMLNALAGLAVDQGTRVLSYRGPYPSEQLFLALLESFRYEAHADPLAAFVAGDLRWQPAPHERLLTGDDFYVQLRGRIEKVVWRGRTYHRPDWQAVARHAPRRVRDESPDAVRCSLWALGGVLDEHLELSVDGEPRRILAEPGPTRPVRPLPPAVARGVVAIVAATSAPALAPAIGAAQLQLDWAHLSGDLIELEAGRGRLSLALRDRLGALLGQARTAAERSGLGLAALTEIAHVLGDALRRQAQTRVTALSALEQRALLEAPPPVGAAGARAITDAVEALLAEATG